jgi:hypothetical protein
MQIVRLGGPIAGPGDFDTSCVHGLRLGLGEAARAAFCMLRGGHDPQFEAADPRGGEDRRRLVAVVCTPVAIGALLSQSAEVVPDPHNDESRPRAALVVLFFQRRLPAARASTSA